MSLVNIFIRDKYTIHLNVNISLIHFFGQKQNAFYKLLKINILTNCSLIFRKGILLKSDIFSIYSF
jgi:hypothetical protein